MLTMLLLSSLALAQEEGAAEEGSVQESLPALNQESAEEAGSADESAHNAQEEPSSVENVPTEAQLHRLEAASFYKVGLELVSEGQFDDATVLMENIVSTYGDTDLAPRAQEQINALALLKKESLGMDPAVVREAARQAAIAYEEEGWAELAINQGISMPVIVGVLIPGGTFQPDEPAVPVTMAMAGLGIGVGGAYLLDQYYDIDRGHAMAIFTGEWVGLMNGYLASAIALPRDYRGHWRYMLGGTVIGGAAGAAAGHYLDISSADMALVNAGGIWAGVLGLTSMYYFPADDEASSFIRFSGAVNVGMALAAGLTTRWNPSRKRLSVIQMSAVAGAALGLGTGFMGIDYGNWDNDSYPAVILTSAVVGAAVGGFLSGRMDDDSAAMGSLLNTSGEGWSLGAPMPTVIAGPAGSRGVGLSLANGRF